MWSIQLIIALASSAAFTVAAPFPDAIEEQDVQIFKRGEPLTPEDIEFADIHGVNTTEMFKHSVIKRQGEEDFTIWVDNSFDQDGAEPSPSIIERAMSHRIIHPFAKYPTHRHQCFIGITHNGDTGPNAPCTGGIKRIRDFARNNPGFWRLREQNTHWRVLIAAGSNTGCNARFRAQRQYGLGDGSSIQIGNVDLHNLVATNLGRFSRWYNGRERMRAYGTASCGEYQTPINYQINSYDWQI